MCSRAFFGTGFESIFEAERKIFRSQKTFGIIDDIY